MSNSQPSAIVLHGIPCMYGLYKFSWITQVSIRMEKTVRSRFAAIHLFRSDEQQPAERNCAPRYSLHVRIIQVFMDYTSFDSNGENGSLKVRRDSPFLDRA